MARVFTRREILGLGAISLGSLATASPVAEALMQFAVEARRKVEGVDWTAASYRSLDFWQHPEFIVDNPAFVERIMNDLESMMGIAEQHLANPEGESVILDRMQWIGNAKRLLSETQRWAVNVLQTKQEGLVYVEEEVQAMYRELATYLWTLLAFYEEHKSLSTEEWKNFFETNNVAENLGNVSEEQDSVTQKPISNFPRSEIDSEWSYDWETLANSGIALNPILLPFHDWTGDSLSLRVDKASDLYLQESHPTFEKDEKTLGLRPKEVVLLEFDPEVQKEVESLLRKLGIERGVTSITIHNNNAKDLGGVTHKETGQVDLSMPIVIDMRTYQKNKAVILQFLLHESFHALEGRSFGLEDSERIRTRDLILKIVKKFDPIKSMKDIFAPEGEYPELSKITNELISENEIFLNEIAAYFENADYMDITDYYMWHAIGFYDHESSKDHFHGFQQGIQALTGENIYDNLWPRNEDKDIQGYFKRLETNVEAMQPFSKFIVNILIENKDSIVQGKRRHFIPPEIFGYYIPEEVIPLTLAHIAMYKKEDLLAVEIGENRELLHNFLRGWTQRFNQFLRRVPSSEFIADIFSYRMIYKGNKIDWGNEWTTFQEFMDILKRNGVAVGKKPETA